MTTLTPPSTESCNIFRDHLTASEVKLLIEAVKSQGGWYSFRNSVLILMLYRHGLRRREAALLRWSDVDLKEGTIYIRRIKGSRSGRHPLQGDEMRALKKLKRDGEPSPFVFTGNRHTPLSERTISHIVHQAGLWAAFDFTVHAHLLRHACGYYLANKGVDTRTIQDYLGHANIQNTVRYTRLSAARFEGLWD
ncbi:MAG: tyrosine-type recombinase/integrase [Xenococcus sp. (in: cyanobacteria)]